MLTRLRFKNFKAWQDSGEIRLAPLTVLFGTNSAGKTSIPQLLLMMKQTAESSDRLRALQLGGAHSLIDLGTYDDAIYNHDVAQPLEIELAWTLGEQLEIADPFTDTSYAGNEIAFQVAIQADKRHQPLVSSFRYTLMAGEQSVLAIGMQRRESDKKFDLVHEHFTPKRQPGRPGQLQDPVRFYGFPSEAMAYFQNTSFVVDFVHQLEQMLRGIFYLGPLREYPQRIYPWSGERPDHVGEKGDRAIEAILAAADRRINFKHKGPTRSLEELVAERLQAMGLIRDFKVRPLGEHRKEYEVLVQTGPNRPLVKLTDVGFGVSQVLPVIAESFYVPPRSIVIFEQPEIHLHPRVQAELADLFVDAIRAREDGKPRDCQFIVESHSEHFLRRLQRRIAEEKLGARDAALYFVHQEDQGARIEPLQVDTFGNVLNWPTDFFGDDMEDMVARMEAQARRMQRGEA